jgi:hypothetical protein
VGSIYAGLLGQAADGLVEMWGLYILACLGKMRFGFFFFKFYCSTCRGFQFKSCAFCAAPIVDIVAQSAGVWTKSRSMCCQVTNELSSSIGAQAARPHQPTEVEVVVRVHPVGRSRAL